MSTTIRKVSTYVAYLDPMQVQVRSVAGYVLVGELPQVIVRQTTGYALYEAKSFIVPGKTGKEALLDLINQNSSYVWTLDTLEISAVSAATHGDANTKITVSAKGAVQLRGSMDLFYVRRPMDIAFPANAQIQANSATKVHDLLPAINAATGLQLSSDDLVNDTVPLTGTITLTAAASSWFFAPGSTTTATRL